jgi:serine/threonine protein kinase
VLPTAQDLTGRDIGGYRLVRPLGSGGTGMVFLGEREGGEHAQAAVKLLILPPQLSDQQRAEFHVRFRREAATLLELQHPHILSVLGFGEDGATGISYLILPYIEGTLTGHLASAGGSLPLEEVARYTIQLADALDYAHQHGVIHRDIKPSNVLLDQDGHPTLQTLVSPVSLTLTKRRSLPPVKYLAPQTIWPLSSFAEGAWSRPLIFTVSVSSYTNW